MSDAVAEHEPPIRPDADEDAAPHTDGKAGIADIGMIGLGVMGRNLALNMADHQFTVAGYDLSESSVARLLDEATEDGTPGRVVGFHDLGSFVASLQRPRTVMLMVPAGGPVDIVIESLIPHFEAGDVIIDGGNSRWTETIRREKDLAERGIHFVGSGVSGGEEGARFGPALMPGGSREAWKRIKPIWNAIAAKVDRKTGRELEGAEPGRPIRGGVPCATYIGPNGAGHYVKMVHNGIEYGDMQLISEAYFLMHRLLGMTPPQMSEVFAEWNAGELDSFLIEISADILQQRDPSNPRKYLIDVILDTAGQKGTGKWTSLNALELGVPAPTVAEAVFARFVSAIKEQRVLAAKSLRGPKPAYRGGKAKLIAAIHDALYCSKICSYAQGFALMAEAQREYGWKLNFGAIAKIWRGGCIIRARFLQKITDAYDRDKKLPNLLLDPYFKRVVHKGQENWRQVVALAAKHGVPCPAIMSALAYYDSYRSARLPANMLQAQRDYFGAHTFERIDQKRGRFFHLDWPDPERPQTRIK